MQIKVKAA